MAEISASTIYFNQLGKANTKRTIELTRKRAKELNLNTILVATTTGETGVIAVRLLTEFQVIVVTHSAGFVEPNVQELLPENRKIIEESGGIILTCQHAFGGVNRAVRKRLNTYELDEIIAYTLRIFGQGMKVIAEMALMTADAGLVRTDTPVIGIAGTGRGADTAVVIKPTNAQTFFDLKVIEFICLPSPEHPACKLL